LKTTISRAKKVGQFPFSGFHACSSLGFTPSGVQQRAKRNMRLGVGPPKPDTANFPTHIPSGWDLGSIVAEGGSRIKHVKRCKPCLTAGRPCRSRGGRSSGILCDCGLDARAWDGAG
jgi:hypothetical protein